MFWKLSSARQPHQFQQQYVYNSSHGRKYSCNTIPGNLTRQNLMVPLRETKHRPPEIRPPSYLNKVCQSARLTRHVQTSHIMSYLPIKCDAGSWVWPLGARRAAHRGLLLTPPLTLPSLGAKGQHRCVSDTSACCHTVKYLTQWCLGRSQRAGGARLPLHLPSVRPVAHWGQRVNASALLIGIMVEAWAQQPGSPLLTLPYTLGT